MCTFISSTFNRHLSHTSHYWGTVEKRTPRASSLRELAFCHITLITEVLLRSPQIWSMFVELLFNVRNVLFKRVSVFSSQLAFPSWGREGDRAWHSHLYKPEIFSLVLAFISFGMFLILAQLVFELLYSLHDVLPGIIQLLSSWEARPSLRSRCHGTLLC